MKLKNILLGMLLLVFLFNSDQTIAQKMKAKYSMYSTEQIKTAKGKEKEFESPLRLIMRSTARKEHIRHI